MQTCKACGYQDKFGFHVSDDIWRAVVPSELWDKVVCLSCFDEMAKEKDIDYAPFLYFLFFAGSQASFDFRVKGFSKVCSDELRKYIEIVRMWPIRVRLLFAWHIITKAKG